eukprot:7266098-Pyramimonas_sp.AAC.1
MALGARQGRRRRRHQRGPAPTPKTRTDLRKFVLMQTCRSAGGLDTRRDARPFGLRVGSTALQ